LPRKRRQGKIPTPAWEQHHSAITRTFLGRSPQFYGIVATLVLVIAAFGVVAYAIAADYWADKNRPNSTAVRVDDAKYDLKYFTSRVKSLVQQSGGPGSVQPQAAIPQMVEQIVQEEIQRRFAADEGVAASEDEINKDIATRMGLTDANDPNFQVRFQEELARSGLSESQYRDMAAASVIRNKLLDKFKAEIPASAESIRYRQILVADQATADDIRKQIEAGADFAALAQEKSLDTSTKANGGEVGWVPRGLLDEKTEEHLFGQEVNAITTYVAAQGAYVYQVEEKQPDRPVDENARTTLAQKKLNDWLKAKREGLKVEEFVTTNTDNARYVIDRAFPAG